MKFSSLYIKLSLLIISFIPLYSFGQNRHLNPLLVRDTTLHRAQIDSLDTGKDIWYLTENEKDIIFLVNYARRYGTRFIKIYFNDYWNKYRGKSPAKTDLKHINKLIQDLGEIDLKPGLPLQVDSNLCAAAKFHAKDLGTNGEFSPFSSDKSTPGERLKKFGRTGKMAENYATGNAPLDIVVLWLIDEEGAPKYHHRLNMLSPNFYFTGVGFCPHIRYKNCAVQNFDSDQL